MDGRQDKVTGNKQSLSIQIEPHLWQRRIFMEL